MALNRDGLTIFAHTSTGDDIADHTQHVIWFGPSEALDLSILTEDDLSGARIKSAFDPAVGVGRISALDIDKRRPQAHRQRSNGLTADRELAINAL